MGTKQRRTLGVSLALAAAIVLSAAAMGAGNAFETSVTAQGFAFDKTNIVVPAGATVTIHFTNNDRGVPHNVAIYETSAAKVEIFKGQTISGTASVDYTFTAPTRPVNYFFRCDVHPSMMKGTFAGVPAV